MLERNKLSFPILLRPYQSPVKPLAALMYLMMARMLPAADCQKVDLQISSSTRLNVGTNLIRYNTLRMMHPALKMFLANPNLNPNLGSVVQPTASHRTNQ